MRIGCFGSSFSEEWAVVLSHDLWFHWQSVFGRCETFWSRVACWDLIKSVRRCDPDEAFTRKCFTQSLIFLDDGVETNNRVWTVAFWNLFCACMGLANSTPVTEYAWDEATQQWWYWAGDWWVLCGGSDASPQAAPYGMEICGWSLGQCGVRLRWTLNFAAYFARWRKAGCWTCLECSLLWCCAHCPPGIRKRERWHKWQRSQVALTSKKVGYWREFQPCFVMNSMLASTVCPGHRFRWWLWTLFATSCDGVLGSGFWFFKVTFDCRFVIHIVGLGPRPAAASVPTVWTIGKKGFAGDEVGVFVGVLPGEKSGGHLGDSPGASSVYGNSSCLIILVMWARKIIKGQKEIRHSAQQWPGSSCALESQTRAQRTLKQLFWRCVWFALHGRMPTRDFCQIQTGFFFFFCPGILDFESLFSLYVYLAYCFLFFCLRTFF